MLSKPASEIQFYVDNSTSRQTDGRTDGRTQHDIKTSLLCMASIGFKPIMIEVNDVGFGYITLRRADTMV